MAARVEPWQQQPGESRQAFEGFSKYRDRGLDRSIRAVAAELGKSEGLLERWSREKAWVARAGAFDREQDRVARAAAQKERAEMARRHARIAGAAQNQVVRGLQALDPTKLGGGELMRMFEIAVKVERQALGEPDKVEVSGPGGGPVAIAALGPQEMRDYLAHLVELSRERLASTLPEDEETDAVVQEGPEANTV